MTGQTKTRRTKSSEHKRPSVFALLLLFIGAWASIATSPAESSVHETGEQVLSADQPVLRLSWEATSDESAEWIRNDLWWDLTTETGADAALSVSFPEGAQGRLTSAPIRSVDNMLSQGTIEFVVTNPDKTGAVTMNWNMTARVEADQAEMAMTVDAEAGNQPSSGAGLPAQSRSYFSDGQVALIYNINATAPAGSGGEGLSLALEPLNEVERSGDVVSTVLVDGVATRFTQETVVPWPAECGETCELTVEVALTAPPGLTVDSNDADGSVTIVAREPFRSEPVLVELGPAPLIAERQVFLLDVELPVGDPVGQQVVLTAQMNDQAVEQFCSLPVSFRLAGRVLQDSEAYLSGDWITYTPALLEKGGEVIEVVVGPTGNPDECEEQLEDDISISVGVITYGLTPPTPATVRVR